jgi:hypothetical protein
MTTSWPCSAATDHLPSQVPRRGRPDAGPAQEVPRTYRTDSVQIVEASPDGLLVKNVNFGYESDIGTTFAFDVPEDSRLQRR